MGIGHSVTIPHFAKYPGRIICRYKPEMSFLVKLNLASKLNHQRKDKVLSFNSSFHLPWQPKASS